MLVEVRVVDGRVMVSGVEVVKTCVAYVAPELDEKDTVEVERTSPEVEGIDVAELDEAEDAVEEECEDSEALEAEAEETEETEADSEDVKDV